MKNTENMGKIPFKSLGMAVTIPSFMGLISHQGHCVKICTTFHPDQYRSTVRMGRNSFMLFSKVCH